MTGGTATRPPLQPSMKASEFDRWYWLKEELQRFARQLGVSAAGSKQLLTARISARLAGREFTEPAGHSKPPAAQLAGRLTEATVIPPGQRCSQNLRAWFVAQVGAEFRFDAAMRAFFRDVSGTETLGDALAHWRDTRGRGPADIDTQFEFNRFTRAWHAAHPGDDRTALLAAWNGYRGQPVDERGQI